MKISVSFSHTTTDRIINWFRQVQWQFLIISPAVGMAVAATVFSLATDVTVAYGDTESHLNIAKRVIHSLTPGIAQLGGIWLPLPHIMMVPFVSIDFLWRTGLAGSIVSGFCYVVSVVTLYKFTKLLTQSKPAAVLASYIFMLNPNILYLQSTAMTELPLIMFFMLSGYFFTKYLKNVNDLVSLLLAAVFGFCAVLTRYDGWFLVLAEAGLIGLAGLARRLPWKRIEGTGVLFATLAFFGIALWLLWGQLILGNALYFTQSEFSAKTQQMAWLAKGQLPAYHDLPLSLAYYFVTSMGNAGILIFLMAVCGFILFLRHKSDISRFLIAILLLVPFIFNVLTLYMGQSVIFIPHLTPVGFEWRLFNVRYGVMMIPAVAFFIAFLFNKVRISGKLIILAILVAQAGLFGIGYTKVISYEDGVTGLSHAKRPDAEGWMKEHYDGGLVLLDDYARTMSVVRSGIPMQNVIYIGTKPYWEESLIAPEKYARWVVMQQDDAIWKNIYENEEVLGRLYGHFEKAYTSPEILIFKRREL